MKLLRGLLIGFLFALSLSAAAFIGGGIIVHNHSGGSSGGSSLGPVTTTFASTKPCATNFIRIAPNHCVLGANVSATAVSLTGFACTAIPLPSTDALGIDIEIDVTITSNNAVANRSVSYFDYSFNTCTVNLNATANYSIQEFVATVAGTTIGNFTDFKILQKVDNTGGYVKTIYNGGTGTNTTIRTLGYWD